MITRREEVNIGLLFVVLNSWDVWTQDQSVELDPNVNFEPLKFDKWWTWNENETIEFQNLFCLLKS